MKMEYGQFDVKCSARAENGEILETFPSSQSSDTSNGSQMSEQALGKLESSAQAENTKRATKWGVTKFLEWCEKRNVSCDLHTIEPKDFNGILRRFYGEVKTQAKAPLTPSAMVGLRAAIHRYITSAPFSRGMNILKDAEFMSANKMFDAKCKLYYKTGNRKPVHKSAIEAGDMLKLREYFKNASAETDGANEAGNDDIWESMTPQKLVEYVWFSLCFFFGRRGREGWREFNNDSFQIKTDDTGLEYVQLSHTEQTKKLSRR